MLNFHTPIITGFCDCTPLSNIFGCPCTLINRRKVIVSFEMCFLVATVPNTLKYLEMENL